jgi:hypothetical protein
MENVDVPAFACNAPHASCVSHVVVRTNNSPFRGNPTIFGDAALQLPKD